MRIPINLAEHILDSLKSTKIKMVYRDFYNNNFVSVPSKYKYLQNDGSVYIKFFNNKILAFHPYTEEFTLYAEVLEKIPKKAINITKDIYFSNKIGEDIKNIEYLYYNKKGIPYGVQIILSNYLKINIEYCSENEYIFDSLILT
ncbi:hypothetical protein [uncultured Tenacibaculum sp.]|uniref:hypothetical protein n=1 Tax=uncultured Tenacibaculum sp. TaxID=174713 RepID=UPI0026237FCC|nr:hypothetical protein [uncultured Tenacibaculum sp.]